MKHEKLRLCPDGVYVEEPTGKRRISAPIEVVAFGQYEHLKDPLILYFTMLCKLFGMGQART